MGPHQEERGDNNKIKTCPWQPSFPRIEEELFCGGVLQRFVKS
jgi:hypothetical protein